MRRTALVLVSALILGAGAGIFVHTTAAGDAQKLEAAPVSQGPVRQTRPLRPEPVVPRAAPRESAATPPTLSIPRLELRSRILTSSQLDRGPAWWPVTGRPGGGDTIAVAGHRTTHTRPFYFLERLRQGDRILVTYLGQAHAYRVHRSRVISAANLHMADAVGHERLLLTACTPRGSAQFRLVVEALPE